MAEIVSSYFKSMFGVELMLDDKAPFNMCERPNFVSEIYAYIGLAGEQHQGQIIMGISRNLPQKLVEKFIKNMKVEEKDEFSKSAICEMLNNLGGLLSRHKVIKNTYTELSQTLPVLNDTTNQGSVYFMKSDGGTIKFKCLNDELNIYLSLKRFISSQVKTDTKSFSDVP